MKKTVNQFSKYVVFILGCMGLLIACNDTTVNPENAYEASESSKALNAPAALDASTNGVIYDLQNDWSDVENPNGVWALNAGDSILIPVQDLSATGIDVWDIPQPGFTAQPIFGDITPVWFRATGPLDNGNPDYENGDIVTHTSRGQVPNSNVTWTSDTNGLIDITGSVWATREFGRTNDWFIYLNDELLTSGTVSDGDPFDRENPFRFEDGSGGSAALESLAVSMGDVVKLEFEQKFGFGEDYVGVNFTITVVAPTTRDDCKNGNWEQFGFRNQGQCVRFVETGKDSR